MGHRQNHTNFVERRRKTSESLTILDISLDDKYIVKRTICTSFALNAAVPIRNCALNENECIYGYRSWVLFVSILSLSVRKYL